jgi:hypothetical protein
MPRRQFRSSWFRDRGDKIEKPETGAYPEYPASSCKVSNPNFEEKRGNSPDKNYTHTLDGTSMIGSDAVTG